MKNIRRELTTIKKYDVKNVALNEIISKKIKQTTKERYGTVIFQHSNHYKNISHIISNKNYLTRHNNNSFNTSKPEEEIYKLLVEKFGDVKRQYKSKTYPYHCDFYIPSLDLFIEYQGFWTHGKEPYKNTSEQQEIIKLWESKGSSLYLRAIKNWTETDVLKRKIANDNKLNWLEFFNMEQFMNWFNQQ